jgi:hypothetical protein
MVSTIIPHIHFSLKYYCPETTYVQMQRNDQPRQNLKIVRGTYARWLFAPLTCRVAAVNTASSKKDAVAARRLVEYHVASGASGDTVVTFLPGIRAGRAPYHSCTPSAAHFSLTLFI